MWGCDGTGWIKSFQITRNWESIWIRWWVAAQALVPNESATFALPFEPLLNRITVLGIITIFFPSPFSSLFSSFHIRTKKIIFLYQNLEYFWNKKLPQYLNSEWIESINPQLAFVGFVNGVVFGCYIFSGAWEL